MKNRLTQKDWQLLEEALQMLAEDYPDGHPEQERLDALLELIGERAWRRKRP